MTVMFRKTELPSKTLGMRKIHETPDYCEPPKRCRSNDFRLRVLEPNNIVVDEQKLNVGDWSQRAFALGFSAQDKQYYTTYSRRLARRMKRTRNTSEKHFSRLISSYMRSLVDETCILSQVEEFSHLARLI